MHIEVGSRASSISNEPEQSSDETRESNSQFLFCSRVSPLFTHSLSSISSFRDLIEIEDGSVWKVGYSDQKKLIHWRPNHLLIITQNSRWFSSYRYKIVNLSLSESVEADLSLGPLEHGIYTCFITAIDYKAKQILLSNNTRWQATSSDASIFRQWKMHDAVIIGQNTGKQDSYSGLLINVNMNNYLRAKDL